MTKVRDKNEKIFKEFKDLIKESRQVSLELGTICGAQKRLIDRLEVEKKTLEIENINLRNKLISRSEAFKND